MKKILIINLRRLGDIYSTAHLLNSYNAEGSNKVSMLCYKENAVAAKALKNIHEVHQIDRKEIITLKTNKLFSDGFALEMLFNQLSKIRNQQWDQIINYSNDPVGSYIASYLQNSAKEIVGVHYNNNRNVVTRNDWELLFNDVLPVAKYAPIHFVDCYHKMAGVAFSREGEKINSNPAYNEEAFSNINSLRKAHGSERTTKVIGIQLKTSDSSKDLSEDTVSELIKLLSENPLFIPIMLIAPTESERKAAEAINERHNNEIVTVEADLEALTSVLMNIDLLITPDTAIKHIADLAETPAIEISLGHAPFLKQGSYSKESLILSDVLTKRDFSQKNASATTAITAQDILITVLYYFSKTSSIKPRLSEGVTLYKTSFDELGISYCPVGGTIDSKVEIHRLMSRQLINVLYASQESTTIYDDVCTLDLNIATDWVNQEKGMVTALMRDLLGTLRSLLQCVENRKSSRDFVMNLGRLISHAEELSLAQIPAAMFKSKIESINARTFEENAKEVEVLLYELKSDMQKILHCLKKLEEQIVSLRMEKMVTKNLETIRV